MSIRTTVLSKAERIAATPRLITSDAVVTSGTTSQVAATGLTPATGGALDAQVIVLTGTNFATVAGASHVLAPGGTAHGISFASGACATDAAAGHAANQIDAAGGGADLPDTVTSGVESKEGYTLCVYSANLTSGVYKLLTSAKYTVYPKAAKGLRLTTDPSTGG